MQATDFVVARNDLQQCKVIDTRLPDAAALPDEALLVKVTRFAFTANNITYAVLGDHLKYWQLFPAPEGFGNVPVWGFGEVIASKHPGIAAGETLFGYFPMATHLVIEAADVSKRGLRDAAAHRQGVAPVYNAYARVSGDPAFAGKQGDYQALLRPLFMLSFLVDDFLAENEFYGAKSVMLSSASSKTAYGLAHLLHAREGIKVIGLTSAGNTAFVKSLGCYDEVVTYDSVNALPADSSGRVRRHGRQQPVTRDAAPAFRRPNEILRHASGSPIAAHRRMNRPTAGRQTTIVLRAGPDPQARQGMGTGRRRQAIWRGVVRLRPEAGSMDGRAREPWACGSSTRLSRYPQRPRPAGSGADPVIIGIGGISSRPFSAVTNRYRLRRRKNAAQTAGDGKRACSTGRTTVR